MRFIIENAEPDHIDHFIKILKESRTLSGICVESIHATAEWVPIMMLGESGQASELMPVISFEFSDSHFRAWEDVIMSVLTTYFEGSCLVISSPDLPGLRIHFP